MCVTGILNAQNLKLVFMSQCEYKFQVYLDGTLQNETPSGRVECDSLLNKDYHVRIVVDDPYVIAATKTLRPSSTRNEYDVTFNAVRERVYIHPAKTEKQGAETWTKAENEQEAELETVPSKDESAKLKKSIRDRFHKAKPEAPVERGRINTVKEPIYDND